MQQIVRNTHNPRELTPGTLRVGKSADRRVSGIVGCECVGVTLKGSLCPLLDEKNPLGDPPRAPL